MTHTAQLKRLSSALLLGWTIAIGASSPAAAQCVGDCDNDNVVRIPEVQRCVNIRTGAQSISACQNADQNRDGTVSVTEVDACIASFLDAATCPQVATPAATNTVPPATSTATVPAATATSTTIPTSTRTNTPVATNTQAPTNTQVPTSTPTIPPPPTNTATSNATNTPAVRVCNFDGAGATDNSQLQICFLGVCPAPINIAGAVDFICDPASQDANGERDCTTALRSFSPFVLSGVGTICIAPGTAPCPAGAIDCNGGSAMNLDIIADHQIGACTSNADCQSQCTTYCGGIGKSVYTGACESFCQGGTRNNQACQCDTIPGTTCSGTSTLDCPGGSCEGKDNEADSDCHCTCVDDALAPAGGAGVARFRLGIAIRVEADPVCDNVQVLVRLPEQCAPFTTASAKVTQLKANEGAASQGPWTETGTPGNCANFDAGSTADFEFVSTLAFLDSTIGDLQSRLHVDCR